MPQLHSVGLGAVQTLIYLQGLVLMLVLGLVLGHSYWPPTEPSVVATAAIAKPQIPAELALTQAPSPTPVSSPALATALPPAKPVETAKPILTETIPDFALKGIFVMAGGRASMALIADSTGQQKLYKVGQKIADDYTLQSVSEKEVTIEKAGATKTLALVRNKTSSNASTQDAPTLVTTPTRPGDVKQVGEPGEVSTMPSVDEKIPTSPEPNPVKPESSG